MIVVLFVIIVLFTIFYMFYLLYIKIKLCIAEFHEFTIKPIINNKIIKFIIRVIKLIIFAPGIKIITNLIFYIFYPIISIIQNSKQIIDKKMDEIQKKEYKKQQKENLKKYKKIARKHKLMVKQQRELEVREQKFIQKLRIEYLKKCVVIDPQIKFYLDKLIENITPYERDNIKNYLIPYLISCGNVVLVSQDEISKNKIKENTIINNGPFGLAVCKKIN